MVLSELDPELLCGLRGGKEALVQDPWLELQPPAGLDQGQQRCSGLLCPNIHPQCVLSPERVAKRTRTQGTTFFFLMFFNLFLRQRERQSMSRGGAEGEGGTELEAGSRL